MHLSAKNKHKLIIVGSVVGLFLIIYLISHFLLLRTIARNKGAEIINPASQVMTYEWQGKTLSYPSTFVVREIFATRDKLNEGIKAGDVIGITVSLRDMKKEDDMITVGGEVTSCAELKANLCLGKHPTWTNSKSGEVLAMYDTVVKTFEK